VRFNTPRAGTFMYHSHFNEFQQIAAGLYGAIVVVEPGTRYDPDSDRILLFSDAAPTVNLLQGPFPPALLNGKDQDDADDPIANGERKEEAWRGSRLVRTAGLGHRAIIRDPSVVRRTVDFMAGDHSA
jgi:FtsP/CotA-like multicopper oxidase with cupredoxin domain